MGKSYVNPITVHEVSLAIEQFMIGPFGTTFSLARVDVDSPPAGYQHLGAVVEDTPSVAISREKYQLETGIPRVIQFETIIGVSGEISFSLWTNSFWQAQFMLGNVATVTTVTTITSATTQYYGKSTTAQYAILGVADFLNGSQVIHDFPKVTPSGDWEEAFRPDVAGSMQFTFTALGQVTTIDGCSHQTIGMRHYMNGDGVACT